MCLLSHREFPDIGAYILADQVKTVNSVTLLQGRINHVADAAYAAGLALAGASRFTVPRPFSIGTRPFSIGTRTF